MCTTVFWEFCQGTFVGEIDLENVLFHPAVGSFLRNAFDFRDLEPPESVVLFCVVSVDNTSLFAESCVVCPR